MPLFRSPGRLLPFVVLVLLAAFVYFPGLSGGFLFDDFPNIVTNKKIHAETLDWASLKRAALAYAPGTYGRPLATLGFAVDYWIGGKNAYAFKIHSLLVHLVNVLLVFALVKRLLALPRAGAYPAWAAFAIALAWAVHPQQVSSVLYIVQRMETLATTFVILALLAYLRGRLAQRDGVPGWGWLAGSALLAGVGMLAKESAVLFPVYALALELTVLGFDARDERTQRRLKIAYAAMVFVAVAVYVAYVVPRYAAPGAYASRDFTLGERLLTQLRVVPMYLGQMFMPLPANLSFFYDDYPKSTGLLSPATTLLGGLFLLGLVALAAWARRRRPLLALGILWFLGAHVLTSGVIRLEMVFEHRNYFALLGVLLAVAGVFGGRHDPAGERPASRLIVGVLILGLMTFALLRAATWGNPLLLATDLVALNPQSPRASSDLATLYVAMTDGYANSPFYGLGEAEFERGSRLPGASPLPEQGLILMAATTGQPVKPEWWDRLVEKVRTRPLGPQEIGAVSGLMTQRYAGVALDDEQLTRAYAALLAREPRNPGLYTQFAHYLLNKRGDRVGAARYFALALYHARADRTYAARIVGALVEDGHPDVARSVLQQAEELGVDVGTEWKLQGKDATPAD